MWSAYLDDVWQGVGVDPDPDLCGCRRIIVEVVGDFTLRTVRCLDFQEPFDDPRVATAAPEGDPLLLPDDQVVTVKVDLDEVDRRDDLEPSGELLLPGELDHDAHVGALEVDLQFDDALGAQDSLVEVGPVLFANFAIVCRGGLDFVDVEQRNVRLLDLVGTGLVRTTAGHGDG